MNRFFFTLLMLFTSHLIAQTDSIKHHQKDSIQVGNLMIITKKSNLSEGTLIQKDTIRVGGIMIIRKVDTFGKEIEVNRDRNTIYVQDKKKSKFNTSFFTFDIGYSGFRDITDYTQSDARNFLSPSGSSPLTTGDFSLRSLRISNFNLWIFTQRMNLSRHRWNLTYGFGLETNNYFYKTSLTYVDGAQVKVIRDNVPFRKNKLAADYFTVPIMLGFNTNPTNTKEGVRFSAGLSTGFLYSARQKQKSETRGMEKERTDFNLNRWKVSAIGELGIGPIAFYLSYALTDLHRYGVEQRPYNAGVRFSSNWSNW